MARKQHLIIMQCQAMPHFQPTQTVTVYIFYAKFFQIVGQYVTLYVFLTRFLVNHNWAGCKI